jgi:acetyl-CoA C-acetyltransferase
VTVDTDEAPARAARQDPDAQARLRQGRHDHGGDVLVDLRRRRCPRADPPERGRRQGPDPGGPVVALAAHAQEPKDFTIAPVGAIKKVLDKAGWSVADVDLFEVNEAFACVAMFAMHDLGIPHDKVNVHGGATALGHPIGASGARIITTLLGALKRHGKTKGVASLCIGGGEATALAIELA